MTSRILIVAPFDTGSSRLITADNEGVIDPLPTGWAAAPSRKNPLGSPIRHRWRPGAEPDTVRAALASLSWCFDPTIELLFYPAGVGVLTITAKLQGAPLQHRWHTFERWEQDPSTYPLLSAVVHEGCSRYAALPIHGRLDKAMVHPLRRPPPTGSHLDWIYPVFMSLPPTLSSEAAVTGERPVEVDVDDLVLQLDWQRADVYGPSLSRQLAAIAQFFIAATATWKSLAVLDSTLQTLTARLLSDSDPGLPAIHGVREFASQLLNVARPITWTMARDMVRVMRATGQVWQFDELCSSIRERTVLVGLIHEQRTSEKQHRLIARLTWIGVAIALISAAGAWIGICLSN